MINENINKRCTNCGRHPFCDDISDGITPSCDNQWIKKTRESDTKLNYKAGEIFRFERLD